MIEIKSNNAWRSLESGCDLPKKVQKDFEWVNDIENNDGFFKYRDGWYHIDEFVTTHNLNSELSKWNGYSAQGFGFGVVIRLNQYGDAVQVGRYFCRENFNAV